MAAVAQDVTLVTEKLNETIHEGTTISGVIVVGVVGEGEPILDQLNVSVEIPPDWAETQICMFVISADGLYESRNTYSISAEWRGGIATIPYPTIHLDKVNNFLRGHVTGYDPIGGLLRTAIQDVWFQRIGTPNQPTRAAAF